MHKTLVFCNNPEEESHKFIKYINQIYQSKFPRFNDLKNLKYLYLYSNILTAIEPTLINRLSKLNFLRLEYNKLTTIKADAFVNSIQELYLHSNNLTGKLESFKPFFIYYQANGI